MNDFTSIPAALSEKDLIGRDGARYFAEEGLIAATQVALTIGRPLLLTGEPGCGKTDYAFAAAHALRAALGTEDAPSDPLSYYVRSDTTARDLLYRYDVARRFGDAQTGDETDRARARFPQNYITLEALGAGLVAPQPRVVLIDEIDKAPRDLPNDLLREIDQGWFEISEIPQDREQPNDPNIEADKKHLRREMRPAGSHRPLIVITSNVERQLPEAFLRRCVFFYIPFPDEERLSDIITSRATQGDPPNSNADRASAAAKPNTTEDPLGTAAITVFMHLRTQYKLAKKPATAELIDWVTALRKVFGTEAALPKLAQAAGAINPQSGEGLIDWKEVPGLNCLIKLREDLRTLSLVS